MVIKIEEPIKAKETVKDSHAERMAQIAKECLMLAELKRLTSTLNEAKIEFIILKGLFVNKVLFGTPISKVGSDIDILIHKKDLPRFSETVSKIGYARQEFKSRREEVLNLALHSNIVFHKEEKLPYGSTLDVHWDIVNPPDDKRRLVEDIWKNSHVVELDGIEGYRILSNEDLFVYLCYHLTRHAVLIKTEMNMKWLYEIVRLLEMYGKGLDWRYIVGLAKRDGLETMLYNYLVVFEKEFAIDIPEYARSNLKPKWHKDIVARRELSFKNLAGSSQAKSRTIRESHLVTGYLFSRNALDFLYRLSSYCLRKLLIRMGV